MSVAVTFTVNVPVLVGLPVTLPDVPLRDKPGGRPLADQLVIFAPALEDADSCRDTLAPITLASAPGDLTVTLSVSSAAPAASWSSTL